MSMFENDQYRWRETYFVLFAAARRPKLKAVEKALLGLQCRFTLANATAAEKGAFEALTVLAPDDFAALDISYIEGEEVVEQAQSLVREMKAADLRPEDRQKIERMLKYDGRFDVLHFEQLTDPSAEEGDDEMLDPSTLLLVLQALAELTGGVAVDPQSGALL